MCQETIYESGHDAMVIWRFVGVCPCVTMLRPTHCGERDLVSAVTCMCFHLVSWSITGALSMHTMCLGEEDSMLSYESTPPNKGSGTEPTEPPTWSSGVLVC